MSFAPFKVRKTIGRALRRKRDDDDGPTWWDEWGIEIGLAVLEAAVACAPVVVAGSFELYIAKAKAREKLERDRLRLEIERLRREGDDE